MTDLPGSRLGLHPDTSAGAWVSAFGQAVHIQRGRPIISLPGVIPVLPGYVRLTDRAGLTSLDLFTTAPPYMLPDGYAGGWESIALTDDIELPKWTGGKLHRQVLPVTLTVHRWPNLDVEREWAALETMARPAGGTRPPVLQLDGSVFHKGTDWTIISLEPANTPEGCIRVGDRLVRQDATITVQQWRDPRARTLQRTAPAKDRNRVVHVTAALNTLKKLAKHYLHDAKRWKDIAKLNKGLNDPDRHLKLGTTVIVPPAKG